MVTRVNIFGTEYGFCRSAKANYEDKHNRMVKLATRFDTARCALACKMMMYTGIRIGNEGSAEGYITKPHPNSKKEPEFVQTYGLTTLLPEHVLVKGRKVYLNFIGKKQVENSFTLSGELAKQVKEVLKTVEQGETLFEITEYELTKFIKRYVGRRFTPKDFRTLRANMYVSEHLNNTPGVCKASYIDSMLWDEVAEQRPVTKRNK